MRSQNSSIQFTTGTVPFPIEFSVLFVGIIYIYFVVASNEISKNLNDFTPISLVGCKNGGTTEQWTLIEMMLSDFLSKNEFVLSVELRIVKKWKLL